jgi:hypothetical protein
MTRLSEKDASDRCVVMVSPKEQVTAQKYTMQISTNATLKGPFPVPVSRSEGWDLQATGYSLSCYCLVGSGDQL